MCVVHREKLLTVDCLFVRSTFHSPLNLLMCLHHIDDLLSLLHSLFMEICEKSSSNDIEFATDGSWHAISEKDSKERPPSTVVTTIYCSDHHLL